MQGNVNLPGQSIIEQCNKFTRHEQVCLIKHTCSWRVNLLYVNTGQTSKIIFTYKRIFIIFKFSKIKIRNFIIFKFSKIKIRNRNHNSFYQVCLNIAVIHYIFSNFIFFLILVSDSLSEVLVIGYCGDMKDTFLADIQLLDINSRKQ